MAEPDNEKSSDPAEIKKLRSEVHRLNGLLVPSLALKAEGRSVTVVADQQWPWELYFFKVVMWAIVVCSFIAIFWRGVRLNPTTLPLHYLFIAASVAALLAVVLPLVRSRITEVSFAGVKVLLNQQDAVEAIRIEEVRIDDESVQDVAFSAKPLTGPKRYQYERLSAQLYRVLDQVKDPAQLDPLNRDRLRYLIAHVAKAAWAMGHYTKYLDIVRRLLYFKDRGRNADEDFMIGHAYLWAAREQESDAGRKNYQSRALSYLSAALVKSSEEVTISYNLALCLFYLEGYERGIEIMKTSIKQYQPILPLAKWNIAFALKQLERYEDALTELKDIPPGKMWKEIVTDSWFDAPSTEDFQNRFTEIANGKQAETPAS